LSPTEAVRAIDETGLDPTAAMRRAEQAIARASRAAAPVAQAATAARGRIGAETPLSEAASILANELRRVPDVDRHLDLVLNDVDSRGPRLLRSAWRLGRGRLAERYGNLTVGDFIDRFGGSAPGG
jgi:hypothetical protein